MNDRLPAIKERLRYWRTDDTDWLIAEIEALRVRATAAEDYNRQLVECDGDHGDLIRENERLRVRVTEAEAALRRVAAQVPLYDELASAATEYRVAWQWNGPETQAAARVRLFAAAKALPLVQLAAAVPDEVTE